MVSTHERNRQTDRPDTRSRSCRYRAAKNVDCTISTQFIYIIYLKPAQKYFHFLANKNKKLSCRRDRATLRIIEYFTKSLKIIRNDTVE